MPGRTVKDIYMAKSMTDLNKLVEISKQKLGNNPKLLIKTSETMLKGAEECDMMGDEEKAYVLFMRFFNIITAVKKMPEYRKQKDFYDKLIGQKNVLKCLDKAEDLSKSLKDRYDYCEAQEIAKKLSSLDSSSSEETKVDETSDLETDKKSEGGEKTKTLSKESTPDPISVPPPQPEGQITPVQLFSLLNQNTEQIVIMDVRPAVEFEESHIKHRSCINVPAEIVRPGTTVTVIEKQLPEDSRSLWQQRGHLDHIVLVDWSSTIDKVTIGTTLRTLKDALFKYDSTVIIRSEPVVLEGGYDQWLYHYPQLTTNPHIKHSSVSMVSSAPSLDFDYPDDINVEDILNPKKPPTPDKSTDLSDSLLQFAQGTTDQSGSVKRLTQVNGDIGGAMPRIDRSTKPKIGTNQNTAQNRPITSSVTGSDLYPSVYSLSSPSRSLNGSERSNNVPESKKLNTDDTASLETKSIPDLSKYSEELEREKLELEKIRQQKAEELASFQKEKERIAKERESRIEKMKSEENQLSKMEQLKAVQTKDLADLLRKKKKLEEDIRRETTAGIQDEERKYQEEEARKVELIRVRQEEEEKKQRMEEVMRLRDERKRKETEGQDAVNRAINQAKQIEEENQQKLREASERAEKLRQENERKKLADLKEKADREKAAEEARQRDQERREREAQIQKDALRRQQEEQKRQQEEKEKQERYRQEKEREERERKLQDDKSRADLALRLAQDKMKRLNEKPQVRTIPSPNLPDGWEKRRDNKTGRYYYVDHKNSTTQWEPPLVYQDVRNDSGLQDPLRTPQSNIYKTKLKDESEQGRSGGLKRSFSSPDITKLMEEEGPHKPDMPSVDRSKKPSQRIERPQPASTRPRNLNPTYGNVGSALTGLRNLGNTCYMNSIIQCLNNCAPLVQYFLTDRYLYDINRDGGPDSSGYQVVDEFVVIVKALWSGQYRNITPRDFKYIVGKYQPMFAGCDQQDSQEFLTFVMDGLNEGLNKVKIKPKLPDTDNDKLPDIQAADVAWRRHCLLYQSIIVDLFQGMLRSTLTCLTCRHKSVTFEVFMYLSLPIPSGSRCSLQDCLQEFLKVEKMTGSSRWKCPSCRVQRDTEKKIDIWKLPPLLIIALNRFVWEGMWRQKINSYVDFPVNDLSLEKFVRGPGKNPHYQLYGVSNHYGTMDGGHYTAYCKNAVSKKWYKFDDHEVFDMSSSEVKTSAGFVLFYTTVNFTAPTYRQPF